MKLFSHLISVVLLLTLTGCQTGSLHFTRQEQIDSLRYQTLLNHWLWVTHELTHDIKEYAEQTKGISARLDTVSSSVYERDGNLNFGYDINVDLIDPTANKDDIVWNRLHAIVNNPGFFDMGKYTTKELSPATGSLFIPWQTCSGVTKNDLQQPNSIHAFLTAWQPLVLKHPQYTPTAKTRDEDEAILLSLVANMFVKENQKLIVLSEFTTSNLSHLRENLFEGTFVENKPITISAETIDDFRLANAASVSLRRKIRTSIRSKYITGEKLSSFFATGDGWKAFHKEYPNANGFLQLSRPGMNSNRSEALVYANHSAGYLEASGQFFLFRKLGGSWVMLGQAFTFIS